MKFLFVWSFSFVGAYVGIVLASTTLQAFLAGVLTVQVAIIMWEVLK